MKSIVVYFAIGMIRLISFLPLKLAQSLGSFVGWCLRFTNTAKITKINLRLCFPDYNEQQINELANKSLSALGKSFAEMGMSWMWPIPKVQTLISKIEGMEHLQQALDDKNGIVLIGPHMGNWEILNHFFRQHLSMTVMYKTVKIPALDDFIFKTRERMKVELVPAGRSGVEALYKTLNNKGVVAILPDQQPRRKSGVFVPFMGQPALTGKLIGELANQTPAYLLCSYAKRLDDGTFCVVLKPASETIRDPDPVVAATALNKSIEECVRECPEQYQWGYKRFRTQPDGKTNYYR